MKPGDRVFRENYDTKNIEKGTIDTILDRIACVVDWDNGTRTKCRLEDLQPLIEETPDPDNVTISRSEFHDITMKVLNPNNFPGADDFALEVFQIAGLDLFRRLEREIFGEKAKND